MRRLRQCLSTGWLVILAGALLACGDPWRDGYFKKGVDRLTQDEVLARLGPPHTAKAPMLGGDSVWTYRAPLGDKDLTSVKLFQLGEVVQQAASLIGKSSAEGPKAMLYCYRYILTFNEQKILTQWKREECVPGTRDTLNAK